MRALFLDLRPLGKFITVTSLVCAALVAGEARAAGDDPNVGGVGLVFGTEPDTLGIQGNFYVGMPQVHGLRLGGDIVIYLPFDRGDIDFFWFSINPGVQYVFDVGAPIHPYVEGGLALAFIRTSFPGGDSNTDSELGLNIGGGVEYDASFARIYGSLRFQFLGNDANQAEFGGGLRWAF